MTRSDCLYVGLQNLALPRGDSRWNFARGEVEEQDGRIVDRLLADWIVLKDSLGIVETIAPKRVYLLEDGRAGLGYPSDFEARPVASCPVDEAWRGPGELGVLRYLYEDDRAIGKSKAIAMLEPAALAWWTYKGKPEGVTIRVILVRFAPEGLRHLEHRIGSDLATWEAGILTKGKA
jgi:hypothetical protein